MPGCAKCRYRGCSSCGDTAAEAKVPEKRADPERLIGHAVSVFFQANKRSFRGTIVAHDVRKGFQIQYEDGDMEWTVLPDKNVTLIEENVEEEDDESGESTDSEVENNVVHSSRKAKRGRSRSETLEVDGPRQKKRTLDSESDSGNRKQSATDASQNAKQVAGARQAKRNVLRLLRKVLRLNTNVSGGSKTFKSFLNESLRYADTRGQRIIQHALKIFRANSCGPAKAALKSYVDILCGNTDSSASEGPASSSLSNEICRKATHAEFEMIACNGSPFAETEGASQGMAKCGRCGVDAPDDFDSRSLPDGTPLFSGATGKWSRIKTWHCPKCRLWDLPKVTFNLDSEGRVSLMGVL